MVLWVLVGLAVLAAAVLGVVWLVRSLSGSQVDPAEQELRRQYAAGQIDAEEFARRKAELRRP